VGEHLAVVIPVLGHAEMTAALLGDIERERDAVDVFIVDNGGDFVPYGQETVLRPPTNVGWAAGCNLGLEAAGSHRYRAVVLLNNDTRLSRGFFHGLVGAQEASGADIVGPCYDQGWWPQRRHFPAPAAEWAPRARHHDVPFVDGTCLYLTSRALRDTGLLDHESFGLTGWGADLDYCLRARRAGLRIVATELAFLNHHRGVTAATVFGSNERYYAAGNRDMTDALSRKWGPDWATMVQLDPPIVRRLVRRARSSVRAGIRALALRAKR
jgi:GT2 family glycosyltransferase